jgi:hypothetical protein
LANEATGSSDQYCAHRHVPFRLKEATSGLPIDDNANNTLICSLIDALKHLGRVHEADAMANALLPLQRAHGHILHNGSPTGPPAVVGREEHL